MKQSILILLFIAGSIQSYSQATVGMGFGSSNKAPIMNLQLGVTFGQTADEKQMRHHVYYNQTVHLSRKSNVNQIMGIRYGVNLGTFQPFLGYDYHLATHSINEDQNGHPLPLMAYNKQGFYLAYGMTKYFKSLPLMISVSRSGAYNFASVGIYKILN